MSVTWTGDQLRDQVDAAFRDAGLTLPALTIAERLALERALEHTLADFVDIRVCSECGAELDMMEVGDDG
jgi:hypothetical protein